jgi:hypothetical protein
MVRTREGYVKRKPARDTAFPNCGKLIGKDAGLSCIDRAFL